MTPLLSVRNVSKRLGSHQAVDGVSFDIATGEAVAVLGPSGCGKTTLLRLVAGLEVLDGGEIWLDGVQVATGQRSIVPSYERGVGLVFQDLALWPHMTVRQQLDFVLGSIKARRAERAPRIQDSLTLVRISHLANRYPHELSGGEQQRVALARALVARPRLILLDEPLSSLDPELRGTLREELSRLQSSVGATMIYVTHDRQDAAVLAARILEMRNGRIVSDITTRRTIS